MQLKSIEAHLKQNVSFNFSFHTLHHYLEFTKFACDVLDTLEGAAHCQQLGISIVSIVPYDVMKILKLAKTWQTLHSNAI